MTTYHPQPNQASYENIKHQFLEEEKTLNYDQKNQEKNPYIHNQMDNESRIYKQKLKTPQGNLSTEK